MYNTVLDYVYYLFIYNLNILILKMTSQILKIYILTFSHLPLFLKHSVYLRESLRPPKGLVNLTTTIYGHGDCGFKST
jgi:hypothetical protein